MNARREMINGSKRCRLSSMHACLGVPVKAH